MKKICLIYFLSLLYISAVAQQEAQYSQYMFNTMAINPAYAGYKEAVNLSLLHRNQWSGIKGAPKTQSFIVDGAFFNDKKVGLGLAVLNDKIGLQNQTSAYANYSYRLQLGEDDSRLSFGIAVGVSQFTLNSNDALLEDQTDNNFAGGKENYFTPDAKFGIYFSNDRLYAGLSATNMLAREIDYKQVGSNTIPKQRRHFFLTAGYLLDVNNYLKFKPSFLIKEDTKSPTSIDINSFVLIKETVWVGASYRSSVNMLKNTDLNTGIFNQNSVVGVVEVFVKNNFRLGYAFDYSLSKLGSYSNGSHELSFGLILNATKGSAALLTPRYF